MTCFNVEEVKIHLSFCSFFCVCVFVFFSKSEANVAIPDRLVIFVFTLHSSFYRLSCISLD